MCVCVCVCSYGNIADTAVVPISKPVAKQAMSFKKAPRKTSIKGAAARANGGEAPDASVFADGAYKERDGFRENSVIKNFLQLQEEVTLLAAYLHALALRSRIFSARSSHGI